MSDYLDADGNIVLPPDVSLVTFLDHHIANIGDALAYRYLDYSHYPEGKAVEMTWAELGTRLRAIGARLQQVASPGGVDADPGRCGDHPPGGRHQRAADGHINWHGLGHPQRQLAAESRDGRTFAAAPNFAFELAAERGLPGDGEDLDLSNVVSLINGSEPVSIDSIMKFNAAFGLCHSVLGAGEPAAGGGNR